MKADATAAHGTAVGNVNAASGDGVNAACMAGIAAMLLA